jgi:hypothetical protein
MSSSPAPTLRGDDPHVSTTRARAKGRPYSVKLRVPSLRLCERGPDGTRSIAAADFFVELFATALEPGEIITALRVPAVAASTGTAYLKFPAPGVCVSPSAGAPLLSP